MRTLPPSIKLLLSLICIFAFATAANAQLLKKLGKRAERAAERAVERRVEKETTEKTDQVLDSILEPGKKGKQKPPVSSEEQPNTNTRNGSGSSPNSTNQSSGTSPVPSGSIEKDMTVYSKFDFVPGDKLLFFDNFSNDFIGDFPAKWNTNGGGEIVTVGDSPQRWIKLLAGYRTFYVPDVPKLPEEYTIEFDILALGIDRSTSSNSVLNIFLSDNNTFDDGDNHILAAIPFCQYSPIGIRMRSTSSDVNNEVDADIRKAIMNQPHVSIAVNKQRFRLWVNEKKYVDIPRLIAPAGSLSSLKFMLPPSFDEGKETVFISNLKVAEGGVDLRRKLLSEGKVSTNGILFDTGSANIQPQSMGIIRQISQVLQQDASINLKIVGHTDADGSEEANMKLSKKRAEAVMNALITIYNASPGRLSANGMGESQPVGDNSTNAGKAQNRRVEFIKQ